MMGGNRIGQDCCLVVERGLAPVVAFGAAKSYWPAGFARSSVARIESLAREYQASNRPGGRRASLRSKQIEAVRSHLARLIPPL